MSTATASNGRVTKDKIVGDQRRKPRVYPIEVDSIPEVVKCLDRNLGWSWWWNGKKFTKPPINIRTGGPGSSTNPSTWVSFHAAVDAQRAGKVDGIGFALGQCDNDLILAGIDLDNCRDTETGQIDDWAMAIVNLFRSYTEISPSDTGLKILVRGKLPPGSRKSGDIECYDSGRYFTITGRLLAGQPREVRDATVELEQFHQVYMAPAPANETGLNNPDLARAALQALNPVRADDYWEWLQVGMALKSVSEELLGDWEQWSASSSKYSAGECEKKWASFGRLGVSIGSLIFWAKQDGWSPPRSVQTAFRCTDTGNGERFAAQHGDDVRNVHDWGKWIEFDGTHWPVDNSGGTVRRAIETARSIKAEADGVADPEVKESIEAWAQKSEGVTKIDAMLKVARSLRPIPINVHELDSHPWLFNVLNGTINLRTGELREHRREDYLTKICRLKYPVEAGVEPVRWLEFLDHIFAGNAQLVGFIQRLIGMALVGEVVEHVLPIFYGIGANGKSVLLETISGMLGGDYAMSAPPNLLMSGKGDRHPTELASLYGKRFVATVETADGGRLSEAVVKGLTGGDTISARRMREDFWTFKPSHLVVLASNHRPIIRGTDHGIWRRIRLVPFNVVIPEAEQDKHLTSKLREEWPAILRWAVSGCIAWQRDGLQAPPEVMDATSNYRQESDVLGEFIEDRCLVAESQQARASHLYRSYKGWADDRGEHVETQTRFGLRLAERGLQKGRDAGNCVVYQGIGLVPEGSG